MHTFSMPDQSCYKRNIPLLAICQALFLSGMSLIVATSVLVGFELASNKAYASLPYSIQLIATMITTIPAATLMERIGRKFAFLIATLIAIGGGIICTIAIINKQFLLFITGSIAIGVFAGFANYYRFTAADAVDKDHKSRAISYVLAGGVLAAIIGPNLANQTRDLIDQASFAGSYASIIILYIFSFILLGFLKLPRLDVNNHLHSSSHGRQLWDIALQPRFVIAVTCGMLGYAVMTLVMTATPLAMQHHAHPFSDTSFVIQWHVLGMFAPSFFTGHLIRRAGMVFVMFTGVLSGLACIFINLTGTTVVHFWIALFLLGVSWNFLFIGATTLLTETYHPEERFKSQALNDFLVFSMVSAASLSAGAIQHQFGWQFVNYAAIPALCIVLISLVWLYRLNRGTSLKITYETLNEATNQADG